jgi:predicted PurR-regulated permease PerM
MLTNVMLQAAGTIGNLAGRLGAGFFMLFVILVLVFTLVSNPEASRNLLRFFVPVRYHERVTSLTYSISEGLARWFFAQLSISGYYILAYGIVNTVLGIPFGIPIAIIAGLLEFIPYLGGIVGLILSALAAATLGTEAVIWILVTNTIIGSVCVYFVSPYFFARAINVPVAGILLGLFIGGQVGGFFAALLTIPVVTIVVILLRELRPQRVPVSNTTTPASVPPPEGMAAEEG